MKYFKLFADCIPVRGMHRSIICDLTLERYRIIPNELFELLEMLKVKSVNEIKETYHHQIDEGIDKYVNLLANEQWGHWTDMPHNFPDLSMQWDVPNEIQNCIVDVEDPERSLGYLRSFLGQLDKLRCEAMQIRFFVSVDLDTLHAFMEVVQTSLIQYVEIFFPYALFINDRNFVDFYLTYVKIRSIIIYNSPEAKFEYLNDHQQGGICFVPEVITSEKHCGLVDKSIFQINTRFFVEAQSFNTCLNRKIALDKNGFIKNCPSMQNHYGHISAARIQDVINDEFRDVWRMNKNEVKGCRDCEFRYICSDCRAYIEDPLDRNSKPLKCGYDIASGIWMNWSTNPLKLQALKYYDI